MGSVVWHDIAGLLSQYNLEIFAETGTHCGLAVDHALEQGFRRAFSIESNPSHVKEARSYLEERWSANQGVHRRFEIECKLSPEGIDWILSKLDAPTLWWLDAHFPRHYGDFDTRLDLPLLAEIERIVAAGRTRDVILTDDMQIWLDTSTPFVQEKGVFRGNPLDIVKARQVLAKTHVTYLSREGGGFLLALPRCRT